MLPTPFQNRSWRGSGVLLGATLETTSKTSFLTILAPFWDPLWDQFGVILGNIVYVFLRWLFDGLGLHLGSQNTSKMKPKRGSKPKHGNHRFCFYLLHLGHIQGCWKSSFFDVFLNSLVGWFLEPILAILAHIWDPFWKTCSSLFGYHFCIAFETP